MKQVQYLQGDVLVQKNASYTVPEQRVQKGDQLSIAVSSDNPSASAIFNNGSTVIRITDPASIQGNSTSGSSTLPVYEVDEQGMIAFPLIGQLKVEGMSKEELRRMLDSKLKDTYLTNPQYSVRFLNSKITVFGEVQRPGVYDVNMQNINIFEALTLAGDLTFFARRDNIMVIREQNGKREFGRLNVSSADIFSSPFYYLQQNDMVFVDTRNSKVRSTDQGWLRNASLILSILTAVSILVNIVR